MSFLGGEVRAMLLPRARCAVIDGSAHLALRLLAVPFPALVYFCLPRLVPLPAVVRCCTGTSAEAEINYICKQRTLLLYRSWLCALWKVEPALRLSCLKVGPGHVAGCLGNQYRGNNVAELQL